MKELLERIIERPIALLSLLATIAVAAFIIGIGIPILYAFTASVVVSIVGMGLMVFVHPTFIGFYVLIVVILAVCAVRAGFDPHTTDEVPFIVSRGRELDDPDKARQRAQDAIHRRHAASRARRTTL